MIAWSIEHAVSSDLINKGVYVSSDYSEILKVSQVFGAQAILRPDELAIDEAFSEAALLHAVSEICQKQDIDYFMWKKNDVNHSAEAVNYDYKNRKRRQDILPVT